jgi:decaprenylphospho-beta-D-ribofuranose 2-oxidase
VSPDGIPDAIECKLEDISSYTDLYSEESVRVCYPTSASQVIELFRYAKRENLAVTMRGGGHSFDRQSLGDQLVISMARFTNICVLDRTRVTVGAGATWGAILARLQQDGLVPAVTVTTEHATAGGTLSGDCLSRFSPAYGKEGQWIDSFQLITPDGRTLDCTRPRDGVAPEGWSLEEQVFAATIGGLGYLGAVVSITYRVVEICAPGGRIGVSTWIEKHPTNEDFARALVKVTQDAYLEPPDPADASKYDAVYSALTPKRGGTRQALLFKSAFTTSTQRRRMLLFEPNFPPRVLLEWLIRAVWFNRLFWWAIYKFGYRRAEFYVNEVPGFTFFMDGNVRAKHVARKLFGARLKTIQQTFIVPLDTQSPGGWDQGAKDLIRWLEHAYTVLSSKKLTPTLHDVLFLPRDLPFRLSATSDTEGFAVSYAFETSNTKTIERAREAFTELADDLWTRFGGRVYLVKNVCASPATLIAMYGDNAVSFFEVKREVDPDGILCNAFIKDHFGPLFDEETLETAVSGGAALR